MQMVNGLMLDFMIIRRTVKRSQPMSEQNMSMATEQSFIHLPPLKSLTYISMIFYHFVDKQTQFLYKPMELPFLIFHLQTPKSSTYSCEIL